ncbi:pilus assembly protein PilM [Chloroflexota bacterium]
MVTLEFGSTDIKLMEIKEGKVVKWASHSLTPGTFEDGVVTDPEALGRAVKQLMTSNSIKEKNVIASVSSLYSLSRIVRVPTPLGELITEQAVLEALSEVIALSGEEMYLSWQTISTDEYGQQVLVVNVPQDVIDSEMQALRAAGVNPQKLNLKTLALARAVNRDQALILNIESASFDTVIIVDGIAEVMRTTAWSQEGLSVEERAEHLISALELTVSFYDSQHVGYSLDLATPLLITGQMSGDLALIEKLQAELEYSIEPLAPPLEYPAHLSVSQYAVNIGLALKETETLKNIEPGDSPLLDINLLPQVYKPWKPSARHIYFAGALIVAIALLFPLYQTTSAAIAKTNVLEKQHALFNRLLDIRKVELAKRLPLTNAIADYNTIINMGGGFVGDLEVISTLADAFSIEMTSITHRGNRISFVCQAPDYTIFRNYLTALEESGRFSSVTRPTEVFPYIKGGSITIDLEPTK